MTDLSIPSTASSPSVSSSTAEGWLEMRGDSYPENAYVLFQPILGWIEAYLQEQTTPLLVKLHLLYLNTSSIKAMMDLFDMLEEAHGKGRIIEVQWFYDAANSRVAELADEFREDCTFPFNIVAQIA